MLFVSLWFQNRLNRMYLYIYARKHVNITIIKGDCQFENEGRQTWKELEVENLGGDRRKGM